MKNQIAEIRSFNRFYTVFLGLLNRNFLNSNFTFPEGRVLQSIVETRGASPSEIASRLGIDRSYLSRILNSLEKKKYIIRTKAQGDGRTYNLFISAQGKKEYGKLDKASIKQLETNLSHVRHTDREALVRYMKLIQKIIVKQ
jgi:DNA-binding MarR family transcriptional regulator